MSWEDLVYATVKTAFDASASSFDINLPPTAMNNPPNSGKLILTDALAISEKTKSEIISYTSLINHGSYITVNGVTRSATPFSWEVNDHVFQDATAVEFNKLDNITPSFTANDAIDAGDPIVLLSDGKIEAVASEIEFSVPVDENIPVTSQTMATDTAAHTGMACDPYTTGRFIACYCDGDDSNKGKLVVGEVDTSITLETAVVFDTGSCSFLDVAFDPSTAGSFVIVYRRANTGMAIAGTIDSSNSVTLGTAVEFGTAYGTVKMDFDPQTAGRFAIAYRNGVRVAIGSVSGTTVMVASPVVVTTGNSYNLAVSFDDSTIDRLLVTYEDTGNSGKGTCRIGTLSGTSLTLGSPIVFTDNDVETLDTDFNPSTAGQFVIAFDNDTSGTCEFVIGTIDYSAGTISFSTPTEFSTTYTSTVRLSFDPNTEDTFIIVWKNGGVGHGYATVRTVGSSVFSSTAYFGRTNAVAVDFMPQTTKAGIFVIPAGNYGNQTVPTIVVGQIATTITAETTNLLSDNFIGFSTASAVEDAPVPVHLPGGVTTNQSGLTTGVTYYVQIDGTLSTTPDEPSVEAGKALSATSLLIKS